jgi:hypothetical protein
MRRTDLKEALEAIVDHTGRVEDMLEALASIYRERARHPEYADLVLREQMRATAHVLHEASEAVASIFGEDEALERAASRAAYQEAHEAGRANPHQLDDFVRTFAAPGYLKDEPLDPANDKNVPHPRRQWNEPLEMSAASARAARKLLKRAEHLLASGHEIVRPVAGDSTLEFLVLALLQLIHGEWSSASSSMVLKHQRQTLAAVEDGSIEAGLFAALSPADMREYQELKARKRAARANPRHRR